MGGENFNCAQCRFGHHCDDAGAMPGSRGPAPYPIWTIAGVVESRVCLLPLVSAASREWLRLHADWKAGFLPFAGGAMEQPAAYREAIMLVETLIAQLHRGRKHTHG